MAATGHAFPNLEPSQRVYTPAVYPQKEFQGLNGSVTTLQYGVKPVDSKLQMTFTNIADEDAYAIFQNYQKANGGFDEKTGERDYVVLSAGLYTGQMAGVYSDLRYVMAEKLTLDRLRYRYAEPPKITSTFPGRSTVSVVLRGYLDGANSL